jgi:hypothetical protein
MMSAPECYEHAKHCEGLARAAEDAINRRMLEALASQWGIAGVAYAGQRRTAGTGRLDAIEPAALDAAAPEIER